MIRRTVETEYDEEFTETVEQALAAAGLTIHDRLPDGQVTLRRLTSWRRRRRVLEERGERLGQFGDAVTGYGGRSARNGANPS